MGKSPIVLFVQSSSRRSVEFCPRKDLDSLRLYYSGTGVPTSVSNVVPTPQGKVRTGTMGKLRQQEPDTQGSDRPSPGGPSTTLPHPRGPDTPSLVVGVAGGGFGGPLIRSVFTVVV